MFFFVYLYSKYVTYQFHFRLVKKVLQFIFVLLLWNECWSDRFEKCCLITPNFTLLSAVVIWTGRQAYRDFIKKKGSEYARIGEHNGNPLQYSCLGNPMDGYSPWGHKESDMTEWLHFHFSLSCTGEGNGNPLQYSCLENPRDGSLVGCRLWDCTELDTTDMT